MAFFLKLLLSNCSNLPRQWGGNKATPCIWHQLTRSVIFLQRFELFPFAWTNMGTLYKSIDRALPKKIQWVIAAETYIAVESVSTFPSLLCSALFNPHTASSRRWIFFLSFRQTFSHWFCALLFLYCCGWFEVKRAALKDYRRVPVLLHLLAIYSK